jgi:hypothetical protein
MMQVSDEMIDAALDGADYVPNGDNRVWMRAALTAALAKAWRPIEEAPDDVEVLVCGYACAGFYTTNAKKIDGDWMLFVPDDDDFTAESSGHTHWMPLSEPPATKEAGER